MSKMKCLTQTRSIRVCKEEEGEYNQVVCRQSGSRRKSFQDHPSHQLDVRPDSQYDALVAASVDCWLLLLMRKRLKNSIFLRFDSV